MNWKKPVYILQANTLNICVITLACLCDLWISLYLKGPHATMETTSTTRINNLGNTWSNLSLVCNYPWTPPHPHYWNVLNLFIRKRCLFLFGMNCLSINVRHLDPRAARPGQLWFCVSGSFLNTFLNLVSLGFLLFTL